MLAPAVLRNPRVLLSKVLPCLLLACVALVTASAAHADAALGPLDSEVRRLADEALARAPRARAEVRTEGRLPGDPLLADGLLASRDWFAMLCMALTARAGGEARYTDGLRRYLDAWLARYRPSFNPVSENDFHYFALAYAVAGAELPAATRRRAEALFRTMAEAYLDETRDRGATGRNNWQSHRVKLATALAYALGDRLLLDRSRGLFERQVDRAIAADGVVYDFVERDALHYAAWSLEGLLTASLIARRAGEDWYAHRGPDGAGLATALRWLADYADGRRQHTEFAGTSVELDRARARQGVPGFSGDWDPREAAAAYHLAARSDPQWQALARRLGYLPGWVAMLVPDGPR